MATALRWQRSDWRAPLKRWRRMQEGNTPSHHGASVGVPVSSGFKSRSSSSVALCGSAHPRWQAQAVALVPHPTGIPHCPGIAATGTCEMPPASAQPPPQKHCHVPKSSTPSLPASAFMNIDAVAGDAPVTYSNPATHTGCPDNN
jgi:hypothetical protein